MRKVYNILILCLICISSCSKEDIGEVVFGDNRVYLSASACNNSIGTKVPYDYPNPTQKNPMICQIWASTTPYKFLDSDNSGRYINESWSVAYHNTAEFQSSEPQLLDDVIYSKDLTPIYFVGMYPSDENWETTNNGITAERTFSGCQDLMFAPQVSGFYGKKDSNDEPIWPTLHFYHLLTRISLEIKSENEDVMKAWGKIHSITIGSKNHTIIDLQSGTYINNRIEGTETVNDGYNFLQGISYSTVTEGESQPAETQLYFHHTGTDTPINYTTDNTGMDIPHKEEQEIGYVICSPVNADNDTDYIITLNTEKRKNVEVNVNLRTAEQTYFTGNTMGYHFTILLNFKMGDRITVSATAADWSTGGTGSADIEEDDINTTSN